MSRIYLDWNATAPLRPAAREAMVGALDLVGNPSSVHHEGRAAKALVENARAQLAEALGTTGEIVFVSGATEAAALALAGRGLAGAAVEHDAVHAWIDPSLPVDAAGKVQVNTPAESCLQLANSETGIVQDLPEGLAVSDLTQGFGRLRFGFDWLGIGMGFVSAHKIGGPKGVGALVLPRGTDLAAQIRGGGQESGRRAGTENVAAIAGFAAAARAAQQDLAAGLWDEVAERRDFLEALVAEGNSDTIFVGIGEKRLPNTSCFATPGWKGETQVMALDLAGVAISAGSACSSGKVRESRVLRAMGFDDSAAGSAIRVSIGPTTTSQQLEAFASIWRKKWKAWRARAA